MEDITNEMMIGGLRKIASFRFVPLTNQLFSRVENAEPGSKQKFQVALQDLIFKMCNDHPYHCLVPLMALANGKIVGSDAEASTYLENTGRSKVDVAKAILGKLKKDGLEYVGDLIESYDALITAYNELAYAPVKHLVEKRKTKKIRYSDVFQSASSVPLDRCLRKFQRVPCVLTCTPPLRPGKDYGNGDEDPIGGERIAGFESVFDITDAGLHRPKIVFCKGSQGGRFRQLVKGEDEVRQDAIMSQVFTYVNKLMGRRVGERRSVDGVSHPGVIKRYSGQKKIATYNILPLSPKSGVLEWVEDTIPIFDYLMSVGGKLGAHSRYYPSEWDYSSCSRHFNVKTATPEEKRKLFDEVCERHSPALRFFFLERFGHCAESWHTARMKYTRSVAVSSIVGHVLGIGDRHLRNILIHEKTGVVVHIDFGIVFEQGKLLQIPEIVPFRLTRNIVDAMGPCGTEGTFSKVAEETTSMLRKNARDLLTILSGVVADPLYKWHLDPLEARQWQAERDQQEGRKSVKKKRGRKDTSANGDESAPKSAAAKDVQNQAAIKTINKIKQKLEGYEESTSGDQQGVEGQVQLLINLAQDPSNLSQMYVGWAPYF